MYCSILKLLIFLYVIQVFQGLSHLCKFFDEVRSDKIRLPMNFMLCCAFVLHLLIKNLHLIKSSPVVRFSTLF
jgi:hypothetical protein